MLSYLKKEFKPQNSYRWTPDILQRVVSAVLGILSRVMHIVLTVVIFVYIQRVLLSCAQINHLKRLRMKVTLDLGVQMIQDLSPKLPWQHRLWGKLMFTAETAQNLLKVNIAHTHAHKHSILPSQSHTQCDYSQSWQRRRVGTSPNSAEFYLLFVLIALEIACCHVQK